MEFVSIVGALLSAIGAGVAVWQACKARAYRDEILHDRLKMMLVDVIGITKKAREECRKIVTPVGKPIRGVDQQQVINSIRDCLDRIKDNSHKFQSQHVNQLISTVDRQLADYVGEQSEAQRFTVADQLYKSLGDIISTVSEEIDKQI